MAVTDEEVQRIALELRKQHNLDPRFTKLASLLHLHNTAMGQFLLTDPRSLAMTISTTFSFVDDYCSLHGVDPNSVRKAVEALERATGLAKYLDSLPD